MRYTLRDDEIHNVDDDASVFIKDEEGERLDLAGRPDLLLRSARRALPAVRGLLSHASTRTGRPRRRQPLHPPRGAGRVLLLDHPRRGLQPELAAAATSAGSCGEDVHLSNRFFIGGNNLRGFQFGGVGPRDYETDDRLGGNLYYVGSAELRFPLGPARGAAHLRPRLRRCRLAARHRRQRPDPRRERRPAGRQRRRAVLALAARSALDRLRRRRSRRRTRTTPSSSGCPSAPGSDARDCGASRRAAAALRGRPAAAGWRSSAAAASKLPPAVAAVIDYQRILRDAQGRASRSATRWRRRRKLYQDEIAKEEQRLHEADKELATQRSILSPEAFADRRGDFEGEVAAVQRMAQERRRQLDQVAAAALNEVRAAMIEVVGELARGAGVQSGAAHQRPPAVLAGDRSDRRGTGAARQQAAEHQGAREGRLTGGP